MSKDELEIIFDDEEVCRNGKVAVGFLPPC